MGKRTEIMEMPIDIVVLWVDDTDIEWRKQKAFYQGNAENSAIDPSRFRSWDNFHFLFRGIETFAPWVNHIYLVTNGQKPSWLNLEHPKVTLVTHKEIMPEDALPTFSSRAIELCINRIKGLSEHFIYFNDDIFITAPCKPNDFFRNGLPVDNPVLGANIPVCGEKGFGETLSTAFILGILNGHFFKKQVMGGPNRYRWYGPHIGLRGFVSALTKVHHHFFDGFKNHHCCQPFLKSSFDTVWEKEPKILDNTVHHRFRTTEDANMWLIRYWQLAENHFAPMSLKDRYFVNICDWNVDDTVSKIKSQQYISMCINDSEISTISDFNAIKDKVLKSLEELLPNKSSFEK